MPYKIRFNEKACVGCGACTQCENWELQANGKAQPNKILLREIGCNRMAEEICPAQAIKIVEG